MVARKKPRRRSKTRTKDRGCPCQAIVVIRLKRRALRNRMMDCVNPDEEARTLGGIMRANDALELQILES